VSTSKSIVVDLKRQVLMAYEGTAVKYTFDCASGDSSHPTPVGNWKILSKHRDYTSHKYKVPMNFAMFFTTTGEAIHESHAVGLTSFAKYVGINALGSHGCVRLSHENAATLFDWTPLHTPVEIKSA
jgi:lipoprotein-anchoring transpeptidase ErfK/SrfK